jgi:low affinity Fe/Cu permease
MHEERVTLRDAFRAFAARISILAGSPWAFGGAVVIIVIWAALGAYYHYSDTWQLVINTGTTIVTFLMVFLIQNTQNRDTRALHLKLDEVIFALRGARNEMMDIECLDDEALEEIAQRYKELRERCLAKKRAKEAKTAV